MTFSRREFMKLTASASALTAVSIPGRSKLLPFLDSDMDLGIQPGLLPTQKEVWDWQVWMAKLGPKYTGNAAHKTFVEFLASHLQGQGCGNFLRDTYKVLSLDARNGRLA